MRPPTYAAARRFASLRYTNGRAQSTRLFHDSVQSFRTMTEIDNQLDY
jgi:hypothetical protein